MKASLVVIITFLTSSLVIGQNAGPPYVIKVGQKYGYIDKTGKIVIEPKFPMALNFSDGMALIVENDLYGYIDHAGKIIVEPQYEDAQSFSEGLAAVAKNGRWGTSTKQESK